MFACLIRICRWYNFQNSRQTPKNLASRAQILMNPASRVAVKFFDLILHIFVPRLLSVLTIKSPVLLNNHFLQVVLPLISIITILRNPFRVIM